MIEWIKTADKEPPKDGSRFLAKTIFCGSPDLLLLYWQEILIGKKDKGFWACQCGCLHAEDSIVGDIIEWAEIND